MILCVILLATYVMTMPLDEDPTDSTKDDSPRPSDNSGIFLKTKLKKLVLLKG